MARNIFADDPVTTARAGLGAPQRLPFEAPPAPAATATPTDPRQRAEDVARRYRLPSNVILALEERGEDVEVAGQRLSALVGEGRTVEQALAMHTGDMASLEAILNRAYDIADELYPEAPAPEPEKPSRAAEIAKTALDPTGATRELIKGVRRGWHGSLSAAGTALGADEFAARQGEKADDPALAADTDSWRDVTNPVKAARYLTSLLGESAPEMGAVTAATIAGGVTGGPVGAIGAAVGTSSLFHAGRNIERQEQENGGEVQSYARAYGFALVQGGLDAIVPGKVTGFTQRAAGAAAKRSAGRNIAADTATEAATETAQQLIEIGQADPELLRVLVDPQTPEEVAKSDAMLEELVESAIGGAAMGGVLSAAGETVRSGRGGEAGEPPLGLPAPDAPTPLLPAPAAPRGPLETALDGAPPPESVMPAEEPEPAAPRFPDLKPGKEVQIGDSDGRLFTAVVDSETPEGNVVMRIGGELFELTPQEYDQARDDARTIEEARKAVAKGSKSGAESSEQALSGAQLEQPLPDTIEETEAAIAHSLANPIYGSTEFGRTLERSHARYLERLREHLKRLIEEEGKNHAAQGKPNNVQNPQSAQPEGAPSNIKNPDIAPTEPKLSEQAMAGVRSPEESAPTLPTTIEDTEAAIANIRAKARPENGGLGPREGQMLVKLREHLQRLIEEEGLYDAPKAAESPVETIDPGKVEIIEPEKARSEIVTGKGGQPFPDRETARREIEAQGKNPEGFRLLPGPKGGILALPKAENGTAATSGTRGGGNDRGGKASILDTGAAVGTEAKAPAEPKGSTSERENPAPTASVDVHEPTSGERQEPLTVTEARQTAAPADPIAAAAAGAATDPTEAQQAAGNYAKGHARLHGLGITIENAKGSERRGKAADGTEWSVTMPAHYGYVKGSRGADDDQVDVYIGDHPESDVVVIVDQIDLATGRFDEHKAILGASSAPKARKIYEAGFSDGKGKARIGGVRKMSIAEFKEWLASGDTSKPVAMKEAESETAKTPAQTPKPARNMPENMSDPAKSQEKPASPPEKAASPRASIDDFGEKIEGARKDYAAKLQDARERDVAEVPLAQAWPDPDYAKMAGSGTPAEAVALVRAMRDEVPPKPRQSWKLKRWVAQVATLRDFAFDILDGKIEAAAVRAKMEEAGATFRDVLGRADLYEAVGHDQSLKGVRLTSGSYSVYKGVAYQPSRTIWTVAREAKATAFGNMPRTLAEGDTREEAIAAFKKGIASVDTQPAAEKQIRFDIFTSGRGSERKAIIGKKAGGVVLELKTFDDVAAARAYRAEHYDDLVTALERAKTIPSERKVSNSPRVGADHRNGADVTTEQFSDAFGFRGVQFGNYVEGPRRQAELNEAYDALMDLAGVLNLPARALSLNGELGLAFGARGHGKAKAHYEPDHIAINLTKTQGAGSLAHEWWHGLDNYFARRGGQRAGMMTERGRAAKIEGVRPEIEAAFRAVITAISTTSVPTRARDLDARRSKPYWATPVEMSARSFEAFIIAKLADQDGQNDYLANVVDEQVWRIVAPKPVTKGAAETGNYPYPTEAEMPPIREAFDAFFEVVETEETGDGRVAMYSRRTPQEADASEEEDARQRRRIDPAITDKAVLEADLRARLAAVGIADRIALRVARSLVGRGPDGEAAPIDGYQLGHIIGVAMDAADVRGTLDHEIIHALRDPTIWGRSFGLFTREEWHALVRAARTDKRRMAAIRAAYPDLNAAGQVEEAIAELYRDWRAGASMPVATRSLMQKIADFLNALASGFRAAGLETAEAVFEALDRGDIGRRRDAKGRFTFSTGSRGGKGESYNFVIYDEEVVGVIARHSRRATVPLSALPTGNASWAKSWGEWGRGFVDEWGQPTNALTNAMPALLSLVPGQALFAELGKNLASSRAYLRFKQEMDALRQEWHGRVDDVARQWLALRWEDRDANERLMDLMHRATLSGVDPSKPWASIENAMRRRADANGKQGLEVDHLEQQKETWGVLRAEFDALPKAMQDLFKRVAKDYDDMGDAFEAAVLENIRTAMRIGLKRAEREHRKEMDRIRDEGLDGGERDEAVAAADAVLARAKARSGWSLKARIGALRAQFESNRLQGPYFPLARHGDLFVTLRDQDGKVVSFSRFERAGAQKRFAAAKEKEGIYTVQTGTLAKKDGSELTGQVDPTFVAQVQELVGNNGGNADLQDAIWQRWLETLPDQSIRTSRIHRKGQEGFSRDALRAYTNHMFHGAHQLARLKFGIQLEDALDDVRDEAARDTDPVRAGIVVNEMTKRHAFTMNPKVAAWSTGVSSFAFVMYLGASPAAAIVNVSQTTVMGIPILAAGYKKATVRSAAAELSKAARDYADGWKASGFADPSARLSARLTDDERAAVREAERRAIIDKTQGHELAGVAETGVEYSGVREKWMRRIGFFFHHAERLNRETTFLAAYRLGRKDGLGYGEAIEAAADMTLKVHFSYQNSDRPRVMQGDWPRVFLIFRQFSMNMLWRLFRDTHQALNGASEAEKTEARCQLIGVTLSMMAHAGIRGTWGYGILLMLLGVFFDGGDDEAEEWILNLALKEPDEPGAAAWNYIAGMALNGAPGHVAGLDLTERLGMPNLWFRGAGRDLERYDLFNHWMAELAGPAGGLAERAVLAYSDAKEGEWWRAFENAAPKFVRDVSRGARYSIEGVTTRTGDAVLEDVSPLQALAQASGFTPAQVSERYDANRRMKNKEGRLEKERSSIQHEIRDALIAGERITPEMRQRVRDWNRAYPENKITRETRNQSVESKRRASRRNEFGIQINPRLNDRIRGDAAPLVYN